MFLYVWLDPRGYQYGLIQICATSEEEARGMIEVQLKDNPLPPTEAARVKDLLLEKPQAFALKVGFILWSLPDLSEGHGPCC